jgi:hypothetical protein
LFICSLMCAEAILTYKLLGTPPPPKLTCLSGALGLRKFYGKSMDTYLANFRGKFLEEASHVGKIG